MQFPSIQFDKNTNVEFYKTLQKRVRAYFKENNLSRYANSTMILKTFLMLTLYLTPFVLLMTVFSHPLMILFMWFIMGFGLAGIGLSIMHDGNHGAYSKHKWVNNLVGLVLYMCGGSPLMWRIQHNVLHHTYTNVTGMDEDIDPGKIMRFSPHEERLKHHKYQHVYAWFLYGLMTLLWITSKDFKQVIRYNKLGLLKAHGKTFGGVLTTIILGKIGYYAIALVLPLVFSPVAWWITLIGFFMMHYIAGLILGLIFQPAHVVPSADYPMPDESGHIKADWAVSQLINTANFAPESKLLSWYVGGLNFQIEHHLFPNICHVHYKRLSRIVKETAAEYNLPYNSEKTFAKAIAVHAQMLKKLGNQDTV